MLTKNQNIDNYIVTFPIKESTYAETYRVKDKAGTNYFLKLIDCNKLQHSQFTNDGGILEVEISKQLTHANVAKYHDSGEILIGNTRYFYVVFDFIAGETLAQKISREQSLSVYDSKQIVLGILNGVKYLHNRENPIIHNDISIQNIMMDLSCNKAIPKIIDFGHARYKQQSISTFVRNDLNVFYLSPEALNGVFSESSDLYAVGAVLYFLLFGLHPFFIELSQFKKNPQQLIPAVINAKHQSLRLPNIHKFELDEQLLLIMEKALAFNPDERFASAEEFIKALNGEILLTDTKVKSDIKTLADKENETSIRIKKGNGFKDVAGMTSLKEQLQSDVIEVIRNPQKAEELGISIPNGLLFYGPPGCGKTYFAEKFAEEAGLNYQYIKCSDVACPFIHGGQNKIAEIFEEARKNAPTILFFDEIDAMLKDRNKHNTVSEAGEVNEFLAQLNNCGEDGVLVIGATNKPNEIDEAALRAGRLEFKYYIPLPDRETRASIFEITLQKRKCDFGIDYLLLADKTENFISADIKMIVDNAARLTFRRGLDKIFQKTIVEVIENSVPSLSVEMIRRHEAIRDEFTGVKEKKERRKIGFNN